MRKIDEKAVNDGIGKILDLYECDVKSSFKFYLKKGGYLDEFVEIDGKEYPVFYWRNISALCGMQGKAKRSIGDRSCMKCSVYERKDIPVAELFFRETEICEWFFESPVKHVFALKNGNTINAELDHECGGVSTLELAAVMPEESTPQGKRRMFASHGFVCDQPIGSKLAPEAVYLFNNGKNPTAYSDGSVDLYGLNLDELAAVSSVYYMLLGTDDKEDIASRYLRLTKLTDEVMKKLESGIAEVTV